jgi:hypothetical protein
MSTIIRDEKLIRIAKSVKPDNKKRIVLPKILVGEGISYQIYYNSIGQIILDPQVTIPASEAWLFDNPDAIASVRRGLSDAAKGKVSKVNLDTL